MRLSRRTSIARPALELLECRDLPASLLSVTSAGDSPDVTGTLREVLGRAMAGDTIVFDIQDQVTLSRNLTITLNSGLFVSVPVVIEGGSQPGGFTITLDGNGGAFSGLNLDSGVTVRDLTIIRCQGAGISVTGSNVVIADCHLGTDATGTVALGNGAGIVTEISPAGAQNVTISGNVVSGNLSDGVRAGGVHIVLANNRIGTNEAGTASLPNLGTGVFVTSASDIAIGLPGQGNIIAGNVAEGVKLDSQVTNVAILGNLIGSGPGGEALGNSLGISIAASNPADFVTIGGTAAGQGNVISANRGAGILAVGNGGYVTRGGVISGTPLDLLIAGNRIGVAPDDLTPLGNAGDGVSVSTPGLRPVNMQVTITENTIANNGGTGVAVPDGFGAAILDNSIYGNAGLGIDLGPLGVNPNVDVNPGTGANLSQNYPVLTSVSRGDGVSLVTGTLRSAPNAMYTLNFFAVDSTAPVGYGQGRIRLGQATVTTDSAGLASFRVATSAAPSLSFVSATATDAQGNTSEFAADVQAPYVPPVVPSLPYLIQGPRISSVIPIRLNGGRIRIKVTFDRPVTSASARSSDNYRLGIVFRAARRGQADRVRAIPLFRPKYDAATRTVTLLTRRAVGCPKPPRLTVVGGLPGVYGSDGLPLNSSIPGVSGTSFVTVLRFRRGHS